MDTLEIDDIEISKSTLFYLAAVMLKIKEIIADDRIEDHYLSDKIWMECYIAKKIPIAMRRVLIDQDNLLERYTENPNHFSCIAEQIYRDLGVRCPDGY
jgi:hypothetical protein